MQDKINFTNRDSMYEAAAAILQGKSVTVTEGLSLDTPAKVKDTVEINKIIKKELGVHLSPVYFDNTDMVSGKHDKVILKDALNGKHSIQDLVYFVMELKEETIDESISTDVAETILDGLMSTKFEKWYNRFLDYDDDQLAERDKMIRDIKLIFS